MRSAFFCTCARRPVLKPGLTGCVSERSHCHVPPLRARQNAKHEATYRLGGHAAAFVYTAWRSGGEPACASLAAPSTTVRGVAFLFFEEVQRMAWCGSRGWVLRTVWRVRIGDAGFCWEGSSEAGLLLLASSACSAACALPLPHSHSPLIALATLSPLSLLFCTTPVQPQAVCFRSRCPASRQRRRRRRRRR